MLGIAFIGVIILAFISFADTLLLNIPINDAQNYLYCGLQFVVEMFDHLT